jgi:hypothetical protein
VFPRTVSSGSERFELVLPSSERATALGPCSVTLLLQTFAATGTTANARYCRRRRPRISKPRFLLFGLLCLGIYGTEG